ncbi:MAG: DNA-processing protein DprA [Propionibacteriaceae bacterium]|jgi:DNA processing protein|nr:DNA-processing protein DprA [Propionibacteriaceae bacterium]
MTEERDARMGLAAAHDAGDLGLAKLLAERSVVEVWEYVRSGRGNSTLAHRAAAVDLTAVARETAGARARFVIPGDDEWPAALDDLAWGDPVGGFGGAPVGLWVSGPARLCDLTAAVAIVGSRASTTYGEHVAADWAAGLAEGGHAIVSGGAYGIDACAHRGAIAAGGATVAVMAGGLAQFYPPGNSALLQRVQEIGAVVSEYPPDRPPSRARFLVRNRLIAALGKVTVIVEAGVRSGAQNTVSWALALGRPVLAAPGPVTSAMSHTPHRLIRSGEATLVTSVEEILATLGPVDVSRPEYVHQQDTLFDTLSAEQRTVHEAMPARGNVSVDELAMTTGTSVLSLLVSLGHLKLAGLVDEPSPGLWQLAKPAAHR